MSTGLRRKSFDAETSRAIGERIKDARGAASQEVFATEIGVSRTALANYEAGRRLPNDLVLSKISEVSGVPVQTLMFGDTLVPLDLYARRIEDAAIAAAQKAPGFIPRFMVSDDEYALIALHRLMSNDKGGMRLVEEVVRYWEDTLEQAKSIHSAPPIEWGEGHLKRLQAALRRGQIDEGFDPHQMLWVTFWEEVQARREEAKNFRFKGPQKDLK